MSEAWTFTGSVTSAGLTGQSVTLVEGQSFCISSSSGDIDPGTAHGLFDRDTRFLSRWQLLVNDAPPMPLAILPDGPFAGGFMARGCPSRGHADSTLLVFRHRYVGSGMREDLVLRNLANEPAACTLTIIADADFAHIFEVKEERVAPRGDKTVEEAPGKLTYLYNWRGIRRGVVIDIPNSDALVAGGTLTIQAVVPSRGEWRTCVQVSPIMDEGPLEARYRCGESLESATPVRRLESWRKGAPSVRSGHEGLKSAIAHSQEDIGALRIFDPDFPDLAVVAAGAPWFMTLFGRDSLITSWMCLLVDPTLAAGTLRTLARFQGTKVDPLSEEEPGRIPHEMRWGLGKPLAHGSGNLYYGSIDATPLFVILLGELRRWGLAQDVVDELLPHADRALEWIQQYGDRDGDGFVEYQRATNRGLLHQGWKDSWDGISFASGRLAEPPIALCEVQGYAYAAYVARAHFAREAGDFGGAQRWAASAAKLKLAFNEAFWLEDEGCFALGLDRDKAPIDAVASNMGHCLWTGIVDEDKAVAVAERLLSPEMFTGFGIRTLSTRMGAYNPVSYHNGSIWPHDTALAAAGLMRYGFVEEAQRVATGMLDAAGALGGRLPELFCGFDRAEFPSPIPYPSACSPQAWAAASPYSLVRTLLRLEPWIPRLTVSVAPALPEGFGDLVVDNVPLAGARITIRATNATNGSVPSVEVSGLPSDVTVLTEPRQPLTATS